ncbi:hypothetical protein NKR23_g9025 [Pleurostoma richardsiae]|uniref:C2H2-type domain-containing protein n=1 Tax=Pleurostoma richardsiae TaxID=41990 RepID=A0AA38RIG5_9PEZI|nr:hypothetical protein NKR23_g9025 [Pleurostoma richardsiae]
MELCSDDLATLMPADPVLWSMCLELDNYDLCSTLAPEIDPIAFLGEPSPATAPVEPDEYFEPVTIAKAKYKCTECKEKTFARREHLKRHIKTKHQMETKDYINCDYCCRRFSRLDNWRSHVLLHTTKTGRTPYVPAAKAALARERAELKQRLPAARRPGKVTRRAGRRDTHGEKHSFPVAATGSLRR